MAGCSRFYLLKVDLLEPIRRRFLKISQKRKNVLADKLKNITTNYFKKFEKFIDFKKTKKEKTNPTKLVINIHLDLEKSLKTAYSTLKNNLTNTVIKQIRIILSSFFVKLVVELLRRWELWSSVNRRKKQHKNLETNETRRKAGESYE